MDPARSDNTPPDTDMGCGSLVRIKKAQKEGLIIISASGNVIRFVPPLVIEKKHVDEMIAKLKKCLQ